MSLNRAQRDISAELTKTLLDINKQILEVEKLASSLDCNVHEIRTHRGDLMLTPLLVAKAQALAGLAHIHGGSNVR